MFVTLSLLNYNTSRQSNVLNGRIILTATSSHSLSFLFLLFFFPLQIRTQTARTTSVSHLACLICNVWLPPPLISHVGVQDSRLQDAKLCSVTKRISPGDSMELIQDPHFCFKRRLPLLPPRPSSRKTTPLFHIPAGQRTEWWIYINVTHLIWCCLTSP